ncbi:MAG: hypothetical protein ABSG51_18030, partial [Terracidiphilus sp.]
PEPEEATVLSCLPTASQPSPIPAHDQDRVTSARAIDYVDLAFTVAQKSAGGERGRQLFEWMLQADQLPRPGPSAAAGEGPGVPSA